MPRKHLTLPIYFAADGGAGSGADKNPPGKDGEEPKSPAEGDLGDKGKVALNAERAAKKAAEHRAAMAEAELKKYQDKEKSAEEKFAEAVAAQAKAEHRALLLEVAAEKGLTPAQAKRLQGDDRQALEADADELLTTFGTKPEVSKDPAEGQPAQPTSNRPKDHLTPPTGGADPTSPPAVDADKLAADIVGTGVV